MGSAYRDKTRTVLPGLKGAKTSSLRYYNSLSMHAHADSTMVHSCSPQLTFPNRNGFRLGEDLG